MVKINTYLLLVLSIFLAGCSNSADPILSSTSNKNNTTPSNVNNRVVVSNNTDVTPPTTTNTNTTPPITTPTTSTETTSSESETWQIQGAGHSYETATTVIDDGSTLAYAFHYGPEAPTNLVGTTKFYYNPMPNSAYRNGIRPASNNSTATNLEALSGFKASDNGIKIICDQMNLADCSTESAYYMTASQAIPLQNTQTIRMFFEAKDLSEKVTNGPPPTQIFSIDSQDGYTGEDFNTGSSTVCGGSRSADYVAGGNCPLSLVVAADESTGLNEARQFKIGYPILDDWRWDEAPGTFMVITGADRCQKTNDGLFYGVFDGSNWQVQKDDTGCAKTLVPYAHGPVLVHEGDGRYKLYYEDIMSNVSVGKVTKPLRFITADATRTGDPTIVDFEDWDSYTNAGEVNFLWPDGTTLTADEESGLGDHFIYTPDGVDSRLMYVNLGGFDNQANPQMSHGLGVALPVQ